MYPIDRWTAIGSATMSWPATRARPSVGGRTVARIRIVVVLPAPFGPRNPKTVRSGTWNVAPSSAFAPSPRTRWYTFVRPSTSIIDRSDESEADHKGRGVLGPRSARALTLRPSIRWHATKPPKWGASVGAGRGLGSRRPGRQH